jgi:hypothetical protein
MCLTAAAHAGLSFSGRGLAIVSGKRSRGHVKGRRWPRFPAPNFHRDDSSANLLGPDMGRQFRTLPSRRNLLTVVQGSPHTFAR